LKKDIIKEALVARDYIGIRRIAEEDKSCLRALKSVLFDKSQLVKWRAIEAIGVICADRYSGNPEFVREVIRSFLWGMNDESGNLIPAAPEAISEILVRVPALIDDYAHNAASQMETEPFKEGGHFALARLSFLRREIFREYIDSLKNSLKSADAFSAVFAGVALRNMGIRVDTDFISKSEIVFENIVIYNFRWGEMEELTAGGLFLHLYEYNIRDYFLHPPA